MIQHGFLILEIILICIGLFIFLKISKIKIEKDKQIQQKKQLIHQIFKLAQQKDKIKKELQQQIEDLKKNLSYQIDYLENSKSFYEKELINLKTTYSDKKEELFKIQDEIKKTRTEADQLYEQEKELIEKRVNDFKENASKAADYYFNNIQKAYETADAVHAEKMAKLKAEWDEAAAALQNLKDTRKAAHEAILKQKEIKANKDNYRLMPSSSDLQDIHSLERIKQNLHKPRVLSMLIWQTFWQPIAKKQFPVILKDKTKMGIYKITNLQTDQSYIGQSVDIYKRWSQHCKAGLGIDTPVGNKLYKAIQTYGLENFTFELLCECSKQQLDEKERYFIDLYQADTFGYNSTIGNK